MKYKVSKEELDALFREVYSSSFQEDISKDTLIPTKEYIFLAYKYKNIIKRQVVSSLPLKIKLKRFGCYEGKEVQLNNLFISGYDVEKKFRIYITVDSGFEEGINKKFSTGFNSILDKNFNVQKFLEGLSEQLISEIKKDYPYSYKKINLPVLQFYDNDFIKLEYILSVEEEEGEISIWMDKAMVESEEVSPLIVSSPTTAGKKKIKKLIDMLDVRYTLQSEIVNIPISQLKSGNEINLNLRFKNTVG